MSQQISDTSLQELLTPFISQVEADLGQWLVEPGVPSELAEAMQYCAAGGKRLRPSIVYLSASAVGGDYREILVRRAAVAVELVHGYSLVHDDLPAMDNDEVRRGRPTAHIKFGEAMAILVGDGMLTRAMGLMAEYNHKNSGALVAELASGAGSAGMVGGQVADLNLCSIPSGTEGAEYIIVKKTATLLMTAARMGVIAAGGSDTELTALSQYALKLGMAFQVFDDLLDSEDEDGHSIVKVMGTEGARRFGEQLTSQAINALDLLGNKAEKLRQLAILLLQRKY